MIEHKQFRPVSEQFLNYVGWVLEKIQESPVQQISTLQSGQNFAFGLNRHPVIPDYTCYIWPPKQVYQKWKGQGQTTEFFDSYTAKEWKELLAVIRNTVTSQPDWPQGAKVMTRSSFIDIHIRPRR